VSSASESGSTTIAATLTNQSFQALLEAAPDAIVIVDTEGRIVLANGQVERLFGYLRAELIGQFVDVLLPEQLRTRHSQHRSDYFAAPRTRPMGIGIELLARRKDGSTFPVEISLSTLPTDHGMLATSIIRDITVQRQQMTDRLSAAEAAVLQAARLAAVGQLAASVAHEINNPLYAARNALYLIEDELPEELRKSPFLGIARDELARIASIIEHMRDFYRPTRSELALHDLNHLLEETLTIASLNMRHAAIQVLFTPAIGLQPVLCNSDQLRQVFLNLMLNAIDAMPNGGTLTVHTTTQANILTIEITDTGIGIPEALRDRLFEPFFTNKPNGTGLGLSISAHIVTQHGGQIEVESKEGHGTTFRVVLPYRAQ
jgi:two-component system, LuxR family, sensor kinase FixL